MRGFVLALLLGAVLQSWGQKFPGVLPGIPKLSFELPKLTECGAFPPCLTKPGQYVTGMHTLRSFVNVFATFEPCCNVRLVLIEETAHSADGPFVTIEAESLAELLCKAARAYQVDVRATPHPGGIIVTFRHTHRAKGLGL